MMKSALRKKVRMTAGEEQCARPNGAPGLFRTRLGSTRSLSRQHRFRSVEDFQVQMHSSFEGSMQSIPDLSHSSAQSTSPVGDFPTQINIAQSSVLQKAAWFLQKQDEPDRNRVLINMGRTIQRTGSQLRKTRLYHIFYVLAVPLYNIAGALLFQALDGEHDDRLLMEYRNRCQEDRIKTLAELEQSCATGEDCFNLMKGYMEQVEKCYRDWHTENRTVTHSMNDFSSAMVYAFSVYTTIGYGNMAADTMNCRIATIIYGVLGIPLFFGFVKEAGTLLRVVFISFYNKINAFYKQRCTCSRKKDDVHTTVLNAPKEVDVENGSSNSSQQPVILISETESKRARFARKYSTGSLFGQHGKLHLHEQRRVFIAGVVVFIAYLLLLSMFIMWYTEFDYFTSVYFLFNSVALIGFGDVFPKEPWIMLISQPFIVFGVTLFSMCYFILQEEIRHRALEASRKARKSISKYSHSIMQHSRSAWSRRNSPLLEGGGSPTESAFDRMRKRRQSAPAVTLTVPPRMK